MPGLNEVSRGRSITLVMHWYVHFVTRLYMLYLNTIYRIVGLLRAKKGLRPNGRRLCITLRRQDRITCLSKLLNRINTKTEISLR